MMRRDAGLQTAQIQALQANNSALQRELNFLRAEISGLQLVETFIAHLPRLFTKFVNDRTIKAQDGDGA
jgi:cell division protein FtsB